MNLPQINSLSDIVTPLILFVMTFYFKEIRNIRISVEVMKKSVGNNTDNISKVEQDIRALDKKTEKKIEKLDSNVSFLNAFKAAQKEINHHRSPKQNKNHCL